MGTRPSRGKICRVAKCALLALSCVFVIAATATNAEARKRASAKNSEFRFRLSGAYGWVDYKAESFTTNTRTALASENYGGRLQMEGWLGSGLGLMFDSELWYAGVNGSDIYFYYFNLPLGLRVFGGDDPMASEFALFFGPSLTVWPEVRAHLNQVNYDLVNPKTFGGYLGGRLRAKIAPQYTVELNASYMFPYRMIGTSGGALSASGTRTVGGSVLLDYKFYDGFGGAIGYMYELNRLTYVPSGNFNNFPQTINVDVSAGFLSLRFWF